MTKAERKALMEKVEKLLRIADLSNGGSEHECALAAKRAAEIMAKYNIELDENPQSRIAEYVIPFINKSLSRLELNLQAVFGEFAGVRVFHSSRGLIVIGTEIGYRCFKEHMETATAFFDRAWNSLKKTLPDNFTRTNKLEVRRSYEKGFASGIKQFLDETCTSLKLYRPGEEIKDFLKQEDYNIEEAIFNSNFATNLTAMMSGRKAGYDSQAHNRLSAQ